MNKMILLILLMGIMSSARAQETRIVNLEELRQALLNNNLDLKLSSQEIKLRQKEYDLNTKSKLPSVQFSGVFSSTNVPLHAFGTRLQQSRIFPEDFETSRLNTPSHIENFQAIAMVVQPLLNLDMKHQRNASQFNLEVTKNNHKRTEEQVLYQLETAYLDLQFLYRLKSELKLILERTYRTIHIAKNALKVGYAYPDDVLKAEIRSKEVADQILETELQIKTLSDNLNYLSGRSLNTLLQPMESLDTTITIETRPILNLNRPDLMALQYQVQASKEQTLRVENSKKPRLNAFLSYEANLHDFINGGNGYLAGVQLSWQLFDGSKTAINIQKSKVNQMKATLTLEKNQKESKKALNYFSHQNQITKAKISTAKSAIVQAKETLRISINRYQEGLEKTEALITKEIDLSQRLIALQQLYLNYQKNLKAIAFTAG